MFVVQRKSRFAKFKTKSAQWQKERRSMVSEKKRSAFETKFVVIQRYVKSTRQVHYGF